MHPPVPRWLTAICCVIPFLALLGFAVGNICGTAVGSAGLVAVVMLCSQICSRVLGANAKPTTTASTQASNGKPALVLLDDTRETR
jgi:hypothetical protein